MTFVKFAKTGLVVSSFCSALAATGCSSVTKTPIEEILAVQTVVPTTRPGEKIEGIPSADEIALTDPQTEEAGKQAVASAVAEAAETEGPTTELASTAEKAGVKLAYAAPAVPTASDALTAQMQATGNENGQLDTSAPASITVAAAPGTSRAHIDALISKYADLYGVPESLVHRVAKRESTYNPKALHRGNYGLMQIRYRTAKGMGYHGKPAGLLNADTNLKYAVKYLRGAWIVAGKDEKAADWLYRTGYYYEAKRKGLLDKIP